MISKCRLCGSAKLRDWMKDGRNRDLVYYRCDDCSLWNYDLDCGVDQTQCSEVYISPRDEAHRSNRLNVDSWKFLYDAVGLRHVLEHLPDSKLAMHKIGVLLKNNGVSLLEFPNTGSFSHKLKRVLRNRGLKNAKYSLEWRPGHVNEFCRQSFGHLLRQTAFELVVWQTYSNKPVANAFYRWAPIANKVRVLVRKLPAVAAVDRAA